MKTMIAGCFGAVAVLAMSGCGQSATTVSGSSVSTADSCDGLSIALREDAETAARQQPEDVQFFCHIFKHQGAFGKFADSVQSENPDSFVRAVFNENDPKASYVEVNGKARTERPDSQGPFEVRHSNAAPVKDKLGRTDRVHDAIARADSVIQVIAHVDKATDRVDLEVRVQGQSSAQQVVEDVASALSEAGEDAAATFIREEWQRQGEPSGLVSAQPVRLGSLKSPLKFFAWASSI